MSWFTFRILSYTLEFSNEFIIVPIFSETDMTLNAFSPPPHTYTKNTKSCYGKFFIEYLAPQRASSTLQLISILSKTALANATSIPLLPFLRVVQNLYILDGSFNTAQARNNRKSSYNNPPVSWLPVQTVILTVLNRRDSIRITTYEHMAVHQRPIRPSRKKPYTLPDK